VRGPVYGEYLVAGLVARRFGRPTRYVATRQEDFLVTQSARETVVDAELAVSAEGRFLGLRVKTTTNLGAYADRPGPNPHLSALPTGAYDIPAARTEVSGVFTNTNPTGAYRGAGRPEANFIVERLVDEAAAELGVDPIALRRRNFVRPEQFPYRNALGLTYDSGDYAATLDAALGQLASSEARTAPGTGAPSPAPVELTGVGLACYVEPTGGGWESGLVRVEPDGRVVATTGSTNQGQQHRTTFAQIVADRMGVRFEDVEVRQGDTAENLPGTGTFGSRSTALGGGALARMADEVFRRGREIAAYLLEAAPEDLVARDGRFWVVGSPERATTWAEVAAAAVTDRLPPELRRDLDAQTRFDMGGPAYANGACVAIVGIDPATGVVRLRRLVLAHDAGVAINPRLVVAQLEGGLTQGVGEALGEWLRYDPAGQILAGSLLDYWIPHADEVPDYEIREVPVPTPLNPLGAKGVGEAGTIAAPPAIVNALLAALRPLGITTIDMPLTSERVWAMLSAPRSARMPEENDDA
jgi:carbon-monoxide dehydrogenase large subunit